MRLTKIVATIGPASRGPDVIKEMIRAGMNVARLNASHDSLAEHTKTAERVRAMAREEGKPVGILLDLPGPKVRSGSSLGGTPVFLKEGEGLTLTPGEGPCTPERVFVGYRRLSEDVTPGERVLISDGAISLVVETTEGPELGCRVVVGGELASRQGVSFPDSELYFPALTDEDVDAIRAGVETEVDYFGLSFVASDEHVWAAKARIKEFGADTPVIAKIERQGAVENLDEIVAAADGALVARGDLGVELPLEQVPIEQRRIIRTAGRRLRPVITATQMLDSMVVNARPTRAEVSDVANAVWDLSDAVMLSAETAVGKHPVEAIRIMDRIVSVAESAPMRDAAPDPELDTDNHSFVIADAARRMVESDPDIKAIVCFSTSGMTALLLSKVQAPVPIFALSPYEAICRRLTLARGVVPIVSPWVNSPDEMMRLVDQVLVEENRLEVGCEAVVVASMPLRARGVTNFLKLHRIGESATLE